MNLGCLKRAIFSDPPNLKLIALTNKNHNIRYRDTEGVEHSSTVQRFILNGLFRRFSEEDKSVLYNAVHDDELHRNGICAEKDSFGNYTFFLYCQYPSYLVWSIFFMFFSYHSAMVFSYHVHGEDIIIHSGGIFFFAFAFLFLDSITDMYGKRLAFISFLFCTFVLLLFALIQAVITVYVPLEIHFEYPPDFDVHHPTAMAIYEQFAKNLFGLGSGMLVSGFINVWFFQWIRSRVRHLSLFLRSIVSTFLSVTLFMLMGATFRFGLGWFSDPELSSWVWTVTLSSYFVIPLVASVTAFNIWFVWRGRRKGIFRKYFRW